MTTNHDDATSLKTYFAVAMVWAGFAVLVMVWIF